MFIREDSAITTRHVLWPDESERFAVVGEQYRVDAVERMRQYIREQERLTPSTVFLVEDNANPHDENAVAVLFPFARKQSFLGKPGFECETVGYLPRDDAKDFRRALQKCGTTGRPVETCGCATVADDGTFTNVKLYLPRSFATLIKRGFADDPTNCPSWLVDESPICVRPNEKDYSDDEQRRLYCHYAQLKSWNCLPYMIEEKLASWQQMRLGPVGLALFYHRTGVDKYSEEGKQQLVTVANRVAEEQLARLYASFSDLNAADIERANHDVFAAVSDAPTPLPAAAVCAMFEKLKKMEEKKVRGLATAWNKLLQEAHARIGDAGCLRRFLAFAEQKTLFMFSVLLSDTISDLMDRVRDKKQASDKRKAIEAGIATTRGQAKGLELAGVEEELRRFEEYLQAQIEQIPGS